VLGAGGGHVFCAMAALCAMLRIAEAVADTPDGEPSMFDGEVRATNLQIFPKWLDALRRHHGTRGRMDGACTGSHFGTCESDAWEQLLARLRTRPRKEQIAEINGVMNRAKYVSDLANWGITDYWASPSEFFIKDGDCEDYAIAKFASLRALGVPNQALRILVVQDLNLKIPHAVLTVYTNQTWLLLDNQTSQVVELKAIRHYRPIYSLNESTWWLHRR
jgi:predicted transglutaminase-like cysteine proteinase